MYGQTYAIIHESKSRILYWSNGKSVGKCFLKLTFALLFLPSGIYKRVKSGVEYKRNKLKHNDLCCVIKQDEKPKKKVLPGTNETLVLTSVEIENLVKINDYEI